MLKKIALVGIFALVSVTSFASASTAATPAHKIAPVGAPVMKGLCYFMGRGC